MDVASPLYPHNSLVREGRLRDIVVLITILAKDQPISFRFKYRLDDRLGTRLTVQPPLFLLITVTGVKFKTHSFLASI